MLETAAFDFLLEDAADVAAAFNTGRASASNIVGATFTRIRAAIRCINSFTAVTEQRALTRARALDDARARGEPAPRSPACRSR